MALNNGIERLSQLVSGYIENPDKYVYPFVIKEKNRKERTIITYNKYGTFGGALRNTHQAILELFRSNFFQRNQNSYAYHKNVRCYDALQSHLKSNYFIKLDVHHFFESITLELFLKEYGEFFNDYWTKAIRGLFYKDALSIGFVSSPTISDFYMKRFDKAIEEYLLDHLELHYSRYSDDILLSSESKDSDESLNELSNFVINQLHQYGLEINDKKVRKIKLDYQKHNSISYLGLNISKEDEVNNKITISKRYILFLLFLISKQKGYKDHCYPLENEIKSRVAYLAYNSPISYRRFQKKHTLIYGEPYMFVPKVLEKRMMSHVTNEIPNFEQYQTQFQINIHKKVTGKDKGGFQVNDGIEIVRYLGRKDAVVEIPYFIDSIAPNAFASHGEIKKVILNKKLKVIEARAFYNCTSLSEIELPESLRYIGESAFFGCASLKEITIPNKVKVINNGAFNYSGLTKVVLNEGLEKIGDSGFAKTNLTSITFPESLIEIGSYAFYQCEELVDTGLLKSKVQNIGFSAYLGCSRLSVVRLPDTLITIGCSAFQACQSLKEVYIPSSVLEIGVSVFSCCPNLKSIYIDKANLIYNSSINNDCIIETSSKKLVFTLKDTIDAGIEIIGENLFEGSLISSIEIPEGVKSIGGLAFSSCELLREIKLPSTLNSIGGGAFKGCISLTEVTIPNGVTKIPQLLFADCKNLRKVNLPESIVAIGPSAFSNDINLKIDIPCNVTTIGEKAFKNCSNNTELYIPAKVKTIKKNAFIGVNKHLERIVVDPYNTTFDSGNDANVICLTRKQNILFGCKNSKIEQGIRKINKYAFAYCEGLKEIVFPDTLKTVSFAAFYQCTGLEKVDLNLVTKIEVSAFEQTTSLKTINFPNSVTHIDLGAFKLSGLTEVKLPDSIIFIGRDAFNKCNSLRDIYIPSNGDLDIANIFTECKYIEHISVSKDNQRYDSREDCNAVIETSSNILVLGSANTIVPGSVRTIGEKAFAHNELLEKIVLPPSIVKINTAAFAECHNLKSADLYSAITGSIPVDLFLHCENLEKVVLPEAVAIIGKNAFKGCKKLKTILLPDGLITINPSAFQDSGLEKIKIPNSTLNIRTRAFANCENLKSITLPNTLEIIDSYTFENDQFKKIKLPNSLKNIFAGAFRNCEQLESVELPSSLEKIATGAFANNKALTKVVIPDSVTKLEPEIFKDCVNLKEATLPNELESISNSMFNGCNSLTTVNFPKKLKVIEESAFSECYELNVPKFPTTLERIDRLAFKDNKKIKKLDLPKSITVLNSASFFNCDIDHIKVHKDNPVFFDEGRDAVMFKNKYGLKFLLIGCKNTKMPDDIDVICNAAFANIESFTELVLPKEVKQIGDSAFVNCNKVTNIQFPTGLIRINDDSFAHCASLESVKLNKELLSIGRGAFGYTELKKFDINENLINIGYLNNTVEKYVVNKNNKRYSTYGCNVLATRDGEVLYTGKNATIPDGIKSIASSCYEGVQLKRIILPDSLERLNTTFDSCGDIEELYIPKNIKKIPSSLGRRTSIKKITVSPDNPYFKTNEDHTALLDMTGKELYYLANDAIIPEGVTEVKGFFIRKGVSKIYIPSSVGGTSIFRGFLDKNIKEVKVSEYNPYFESIDDNAVISKDNNSIVYLTTDAKIPSKVERIPSNVLSYRYDIESLYIPENVFFIERDAFRGMKNVKSVVVSKDNPIFDSRDDSNAIIVTNKNVAIYTCKNTKLPDGVISAYQENFDSPNTNPYGKYGMNSGVNNMYYDLLTLEQIMSCVSLSDRFTSTDYDSDLPF